MADTVRPADGIILTDTQAPQASFDALLLMARRNGLPERAVLAPSLLRISPTAASVEEETAS